MKKRKTAGQLSREAAADNTKYDAYDVGKALANDIEPHLRKCIENHKEIIDEDEFCIVMISGISDPLIPNAKRRKFYAWPYLPKPRPNQSVFLYNKPLDQITKRLWILPSDMVMAELSSLTFVAKPYQTMKAWSDAYYKGWRYMRDPKTKEYKFINTDPFHFWNYVRKDQNITMPSEHEYFLEHRQELIEAGCKIPTANDTEAFDFSKVGPDKIIETSDSIL